MPRHKPHHGPAHPKHPPPHRRHVPWSAVSAFVDASELVRCVVEEGPAHHRGSNYVLLQLLGALGFAVILTAGLTFTLLSL